MRSVREGVWTLGRFAFLALYYGGFTVRLSAWTVIVRWRGYVPPELPGWRKRIGRVEIHARRV